MTSRTITGRLRERSPSPKTVLLFLVHSNVYISVAAASVVVTTSLLAGLPLDPVPAFIVFAVTLFVYSFNRVTDLEEDERNVPRRAAFTRRYGRLWFLLGVILYLVAVVLAFLLNLPRAPYTLLPLAVALAYSLFRLKRIFLVKNLVVGASWAVIPLGVGVYFGSLWTTEIMFVSVYVGTMITIAAMIFDVKDIEGDRTEGIRTVPNLFGVRATRIVAALSNVAVTLVVVALVVAGTLPTTFLVLLALNLYVLCYIPFATPDRGPLFYGFVVDGEHAFLATLVFVLEQFTG